MTEDAARDRMAAQIPDAERERAAGFVIHNDGTLEELEGTARSLGLDSPRKTYAPREVKGVAGLSRFEITMPVAGNYRQLGSFLGALERSPHFLTVDKVSLRQKEGSMADLSIVLSAYFRGEEGLGAD